MSTPARRLDTPPPLTRPARAARRATRRSSQPSPRRPARRATSGPAHQVGFAVLASALVGSLVFGIAVLNVLLAQTSFRIDEAERRNEALSADQVELVSEQASLSAPGRIARWARRHGMRLPDDIRILHASGGTVADPAGADPSSEVAGSTEAAGP